MPVLSLGFDIHGRPIVELYVSVCSAERDELDDEGRGSPPAIPVRALVDTGAGQTHIDLDVLARLAILPISEGAVYTASGGGPEHRDIYLIDLAFAGGRPGLLAINLEVFGSQLAGALRVEMLLGRDVLGNCMMIYEGIERRFTMAYNPP